MYYYFEDKETLKEIQNYCSSLVKELEFELREKGLNSQVSLVGSGGRNMVTQNEDGPIDFDYNLNVISCNDYDCESIKELVRKTFNSVMRKKHLKDVDDSKSALTTKLMYLKNNQNVEFSIDVCIVRINDEGNWQRLIHEKNGNSYYDRYYWNTAPNSKDYKEKVIKIKQKNCWEMVRKEYLYIKNRYLKQNDNNHPSFICYIEAVNNVFNRLRQKKLLENLLI